MVLYNKYVYAYDGYFKKLRKEKDMNTREELIAGLKEAIYLMNTATKLKNTSINTSQQKVGYKSQFSKRTKSQKRTTALIIYGVIGVAIYGISRNIIRDIVDKVIHMIHKNSFDLPFVLRLFKQFLPIILPLLLAVIAVLIAKKFIKINESDEDIDRANQKIAEENRQIDEYNMSIDRQVAELNKQLREVQQAYRERVLSWYPPNYCYIEAAEFFLNAVINRRADTIKECVNLYETTLHQQRVEANQQAMQNKMDLNNLMTAGSLILEGKILKETRTTNSKLDSINSNISQAASSINANISAESAKIRASMPIK